MAGEPEHSASSSCYEAAGSQAADTEEDPTRSPGTPAQPTMSARDRVKTEAQLAYQLDALSHTVQELQGDIQVFKNKVQETTAEAAKVRALIAQELKLRLSNPADTALQATSQLDENMRRLVAATAGTWQRDAALQPEVEEILGQLQQQQADLTGALHGMQQDLGILIKELLAA